MSNDLMTAALQAQVSDLKRSQKHANEMVSRLMAQSMTEEQRIGVFETVMKHLTENDNCKANQLTGIIRTTLFGLNDVAQTTTDEATKSRLIEMIKALNVSIGYEETARMVVEKSQSLC